MDEETQLSLLLHNRDEHGLLKLIPFLSELNISVRGMPLLARAVREGLSEVTRELLGSGADPDFQYNGTALSQAARRGDVASMQLLLQFNASPNVYRPLISAISGGSLDAIKLLVEAGASIDRLYDESFTALGFAKMHGQSHIVSYLEGLGAMDSREAVRLQRESQPGFFQRLAKRFGVSDTKARRAVEISDFFEERFCQSRPLDTKPIFGKRASFQVHIIYPSARSPNVVLFTTGLSERSLRVSSGDQKFSRAELYLELAPEWPGPQEEPSSSWPLAWMMNIGQQVQRTRESFQGPYAIIANEDPPQPFSDSTEFSCWLLEADSEIELSAEDQPIQLYRMRPLYSEEKDLEVREGIDELRKALAACHTSAHIIPERQNVGIS